MVWAGRHCWCLVGLALGSECGAGGAFTSQGFIPHVHDDGP